MKVLIIEAGAEEGWGVVWGVRVRGTRMAKGAEMTGRCMSADMPGEKTGPERLEPTNQTVVGCKARRPTRRRSVPALSEFFHWEREISDTAPLAEHCGGGGGGGVRATREGAAGAAAVRA